jgi:hypothetical protein
VCIGGRYRIGEAEFEVTQPRVTCAVRRRHLFPGPARTPSRRGGAGLLRPARHRHRPGHVISAMIIRALLGRLRKAMRSADAARPRPDRVAVSPAIGPLPAIVVLPSPQMPEGVDEHAGLGCCAVGCFVASGVNRSARVRRLHGRGSPGGS